jgi:single-strand DNA-binding protein
MTAITIIGNLCDSPELRFTAAGKAIANFTVAVSKRVRDGDQWKDGPSSFYRCSLWDTPAENMTESLSKGQRVIVVGEIAQRSYETNAGEKRSVFEVTASEVGPSLKWATAKVEKTSGGKKPKPADDPWASTPAVGGDDSDQPPF